MHRQGSDGAGTETGDGLDGRGGESRVIEVGHIVELGICISLLSHFTKDEKSNKSP